MSEVETESWESVWHSTSPGIYAMVARAGAFTVWLYIGMSATSIAERVKSHRLAASCIGPALNSLSSDGWEVLVYSVPTPRERGESLEDFVDRLRAMEREGIAALAPLLNVRRTGGLGQRELLIRLLSVAPADECRRPRPRDVVGRTL